MSDNDPVYELPADEPQEQMSARQMRSAARTAIAPGDDLTLADRAPMLIEQYRRPALLGAVALVVLLLGAVVFYFWRDASRKEDKARMAASERFYEEALALQPGQDAQRTQLLNQALTSEGTRMGLKAAADAGDLVGAFYAANAYYELGQYDNARTYFGKVGSGHGYVSASARAGEAAILENQNKPAEAAARYVAAADADDSKALAPQYLLSAARAYAAAGEHARAGEMLDRLEREFPEAPETQQVGLMRGLALPRTASPAAPAAR